ncbi:hypothetical protein NC651_022371 [Populus alba x Populus x berolinensis]|nr:hypothetical protein NC651_022371 [Populus alba x Populus x berolinensis]
MHLRPTEYDLYLTEKSIEHELAYSIIVFFEDNSKEKGLPRSSSLHRMHLIR